MYQTSSGIIMLGSNNPYEHEMSVERTPPEDFIDKLKAFDTKLYVSWNKLKSRWVIEECIEHTGAGTLQSHTHLCRRSHVWLVRNPDDSFLELCDRVIDELRGMDVVRKYGSMEGMIKAMDAIDKKNDEQFEKDVRESVKNARLDNRRQFNDVVLAIEKTDLSSKTIY